MPLLLLGLLLFILISPGLSYASSQVFGCQHYGAEVVHCDLMLSEMQGYEVVGNSTIVNPLSSGDTIFVEGKAGMAAELRAEYRESIEIMNTPDLNPEEFTISFWIKQGQPQPYSHVVSHVNRAQTAGWMFDIFAASSQGTPASSLRFAVPNANGTLFAPPEIAIAGDEQFVNVAGTFDGATLRLYKNGVEAGTADFSGNYTPDPGVPMRIGSAAYCSSCNRWAGAIDEVQFYSKALNTEELGKIYQTAASDAGLIGNWKFENNTSDELQQNDGTSTTLITSMAFAPDGRLFFSEKNSGEIRVMSPDFELQDEPFVRVNDVYASWEQGMLGIAIDPDFEENGFVYLYYTALIDTEDGNGGKVINRLVRFTDDDGMGIETKVLVDSIPASRGYHSGGALAFGPDEKLYYTVGDATEHIFAQDPSIAVGKIHRINKDGSIPGDNPYTNSPVYTLGHRNMYGIAFDADGAGLVTENGDFHYDELNVIIKGGNYGFPTLQPPNLPPERVDNDSVKPVRTYWDAIAPTQMIYYDRGAIPELNGTFIFGSFTGDLYAVRLSENKSRIEVEDKIELGHFPFVPTVAVAQSPDGGIYYGGYQIYRLDSVSERSQNVYQVSVDSPEPVDITELQVGMETNKLVLVASINGSINSDEAWSVRVPNGMISDINAVTLEGAEDNTGNATLEFTVDTSNPDYSVIAFTPDETGEQTMRISIIGSSVMPEFPASYALSIVAVISAIVASLVVRRRSS
jgi:glucose/arabinose dehydrogenase